jgi:hypothetical protein
MVSEKQKASLESAAEKCALRIVDICRFGIFEFLNNPTATRYAKGTSGLDDGRLSETIQVPITPTMSDRLKAARYCAGFDGVTAGALARIAVCDFARRHK